MIVNDPVCYLPSPLDGENTQVFGKIPELVSVSFEPVGRWYEVVCRRRLESAHISHRSQDSSESEEEEEEDTGEDPQEESLLLSLDPKEWKSQDHYAVLGIADLRCKATDDQIKRAYKKKVLRHHPDKRRARGIPVKEGEEDYFTCITRAYEILGHPTKRRSYDSVDSTFDNWIPPVNEKNKQNFIKIFKKIFELNSRWSNKRPVPSLGDENSSLDVINRFYSFWYDFDSWREYSYMDEEDKEKGENRDERRWIDKQNKGARKERKKEEMSRIRQLVDNAYACDMRIVRFEEEEKQKKLAEKQAKKDAARARAEEEARKKAAIIEEERKRKEKEEEEAQAQAAAAKKEKDAYKKSMKKEKKTFRTALKDFEYFEEDEEKKVTIMQEVSKLAEFLSLISLQTLNESLVSGDKEKAKSAFFSQVEQMHVSEQEEKMQHLEQSQQKRATGGATSSRDKWSDEEVQTLIKAVNLFPAGTSQRWETVSQYISQHVPSSNRSAKETLAKAKDLQKLDTSLKEDANKKAYQVFTKEKIAACETSDISERYDSVAVQQIAETGINPAPWTAEEQKLLEQGLKTFPGSVANRWEKISGSIPNRSKKDCMIRYKELVEMVRLKKAAQLAAAKKK